ncbi:MAG: monofunctional biosynthetic peptidoglycan transglycosylase [Gammaproteobacteria bacterium]|nr:monofunctional biosynthetic peptidoglycan transglycosylase [Gammaproteobacteria bacterium]
MRRIIKNITKKLFWLLVGLAAFSILLVGSLNFFNPPTWMWKLQRQLSPPDNYPAKVQHQWVAWASISGDMKLAVIAAEDQLFPHHSGFDFDSIAKALESNLQGKRIRGASTISQQTAKNLFLWSGKNFLRKGIEAWFTVLLELLLGKQRILELYLNIVELGPGIFGVEAASQHYFAKPSRQLTRHQAARLAAVLPNPFHLYVQRPSKYVRQRTLWIEKQMRQLGISAVQQIQ